jgi:hypothetical protein
VIEYMWAEILELSGNTCRNAKKRQIRIVDIKRAIDDDDELKNLFTDFDPDMISMVISDSDSKSTPNEIIVDNFTSFSIMDMYDF